MPESGVDAEFPNRRVSTVVTLTFLGVLLLVGAVVGFRALFAPLPGDDLGIPAAPTCAPEQVKVGRLNSDQVTVSVYNAGDRARLAAQTLDALAERGFRAGETGNAPKGTEVRVVQVWTTEEDDPAARLVARQFGRRTAVRVTEDVGGPGVDVVVGRGYRGMVPAKRFIKVEQPAEVCAPEE